MRQILTIILLSFALHLSGQDKFFRPTYVFEGIINTDKGDSLKIYMNFLILLDSTIVGSYYYKPANGSLQLVGHLNNDTSFTLVERNKQGNITGYFGGSLTANKKAASGTWTSATKDKNFHFNLNSIEGKSYWDYIKKNRSLYEYSDLQLAIKEAGKVLSIDVSHQDLKALPPQLDQCKQIVSISLLRNNFTAFPTVLARLTTLDEISLSSNELTSVGKEIGQLKNLRILIMNNNHLTELPKEIGELTNLLYLEIGNNKLKGLPEEIKYLTNLQEMHIERNQLSKEEMLKIKKLLPNCVIYF